MLVEELSPESEICEVETNGMKCCLATLEDGLKVGLVSLSHRWSSFHLHVSPYNAKVGLDTFPNHIYIGVSK